MIFHGLAFFLTVMTIVLHQSLGMLTGTGVIMHLYTSSQKTCLSGSLKWKSTGIELWLALGMITVLRWMSAAGPDMGVNAAYFLKFRFGGTLKDIIFETINACLVGRRFGSWSSPSSSLGLSFMPAKGI